jgi:nitrate reductase NapAB chaperone NapD
MSVSGIVVLCRPEDLAETAETLAALPWAEVHHRSGEGRLVATIEAAETEEHVAHLREIQELPGVLSAEMAAYYVDEEP